MRIHSLKNLSKKKWIAITVVISLLLFAGVLVLSIDNPNKLSNGKSCISVKVLSPNGREIWTGKKNITWIATESGGSDSSLSIYIQYSYNGSWINISNAQGIKNTGSFLWDTTSIPNGYYLIKVIAQDNLGHRGEDVSDDLFWIAHQTNRVLINELFYNNSSDVSWENRTQWIELYNPTNTPVNITGWIIHFGKVEGHMINIFPSSNWS